MRYFRRLSLFSRVAGTLGFLLILASLALATVSLIAFWSSHPHVAADDSRIQLVSMNFGILGLAVIAVLNANTIRRQLDRRPFSPASWQSQMRAIMLLAALPLCALTWALFVPPSFSVYGLAFGIDMLEAWVLLIALFVLIVRRLPAR